MSLELGATPAPIHHDGLWLQDLYPGLPFTAGAREIHAADIIAFGRAFDPQPFHVDPDAARDSFFGELVASAWHTAAVTMRLLGEALPVATGVIGASVEFTMPTPTFPGDRLTVSGRVDDVVPSLHRPERGSVLISYQTLNHVGKVRQASTARLIAWRRPDTPRRLSMIDGEPTADRIAGGDGRE